MNIEKVLEQARPIISNVFREQIATLTDEASYPDSQLFVPEAHADTLHLWLEQKVLPLVENVISAYAPHEDDEDLVTFRFARIGKIQLPFDKPESGVTVPLVLHFTQDICQMLGEIDTGNPNATLTCKRRPPVVETPKVSEPEPQIDLEEFIRESEAASEN